MDFMGPIQQIWKFLKRNITRKFPSLLQYQKLNTSAPSNMTGRFRSYVWDPILIISQIISLQCVFYTTLGLTIAFCLSLGGHPPSLNNIFDTTAMHFSGQVNRLVMVAHAVNSLFGALALWYIIQRAKQCLDFACTLHLVHFIICCIYSSHFPTYLAWWLVQISCIVLMVVIGEYLCFRSDMKDIPLVGSKADV